MTATGVAPAQLRPGATSDLASSVANPNSYAVSLTTLTTVTTVTITSSDEALCMGATYLLLPQAVTTALASGGHALASPIAVPAGSTATAGSVAGLVTLSSTAPDSCQGVTFTVTLDLTGSQA